MNTKPSANQTQSLEQFLCLAVVTAQAAAQSCLALHSHQNPGLTENEWRELDAACDGWLQERARARSQEKHAA